MDTKECNRCFETKNVNEFYKSSNGNKDLPRSQCKDCYNELTNRTKEIKRHIKLIMDINPDIFELTSFNVKYCKKCETTKPLIDFRKDSTKKNGYGSNCNDCIKKKDSERNYKQLPLTAEQIQNQLDNKIICKNCKLLKHKNLYYSNNYKICMDCIDNISNDYIDTKIKQNIKSRIFRFLKPEYIIENYQSIYRLIDCNLPFLRRWLAFSAPDNFNIENFNNGSTYEIDHVTPISSFDLTNIEEQKKCFNWTNLQIITKEANLQKSNTIIPELIKAHQLKVEQFLLIN
jgi:hypothetical protein